MPSMPVVICCAFYHEVLEKIPLITEPDSEFIIIIIIITTTTRKPDVPEKKNLGQICSASVQKIHVEKSTCIDIVKNKKQIVNIC